MEGKRGNMNYCISWNFHSKILPVALNLCIREIFCMSKFRDWMAPPKIYCSKTSRFHMQPSPQWSDCTMLSQCSSPSSWKVSPCTYFTNISVTNCLCTHGRLAMNTATSFSRVMGKVAVTTYDCLQTHASGNNFCVFQFLHMQKFCEFNFCDPTPIVKLCKNKTHTKILGHTVVNNIGWSESY